MEKKLYVKPTIKVSVVNGACIMANSDPNSITAPIDKNNPITSGPADAKRFHIWDDEN
jgi:hypothetical protein